MNESIPKESIQGKRQQSRIFQEAGKNLKLKECMIVCYKSTEKINTGKENITKLEISFSKRIS